jgi:hypothetical protein
MGNTIPFQHKLYLQNKRNTQIEYKNNVICDYCNHAEANSTHLPIFIGMKSIPRNDGNRCTFLFPFSNEILSSKSKE